MSDKICGRDYTVVKTSDPHPPKTFFMSKVPDGNGGNKQVKKERQSFYIKPKPRYLVDGINHPRGEPIRFKSVQRAENHIKNMGLEVS